MFKSFKSYIREGDLNSLSPWTQISVLSRSDSPSLTPVPYCEKDSSCRKLKFFSQIQIFITLFNMLQNYSLIQNVPPVHRITHGEWSLLLYIWLVLYSWYINIFLLFFSEGLLQQHCSILVQGACLRFFLPDLLGQLHRKKMIHHENIKVSESYLIELVNFMF